MVVEVVVMMMGVMVALVVAVVIGTNIANPIDQDNIIGDAEHIQLTNKRASEVKLRARGEELHCNGKHICQLDLRGIADNRSLSIGFETLDNLRCWQDNHLHKIKY